MSIEENIRARQAAEQAKQAGQSLFAIIKDVLDEEVAKLPEQGRSHFWELLAAEVGSHRAAAPARAAASGPPQGIRRPQPAQPARRTSPDVDEALELIDQIEELAERIPEAGEDFAADVADTAREIGQTIEEQGRVTERQWAALENIRDGLQRWFHD